MAEPKNTRNGNSKQATSKNGALLLWKKNATSAEPCAYSAIDPTLLRRTIDVVTRAGGAVMFGVTSDGGAYSVMVLYKDQKLKEYPHGADECASLLEEMCDTFLEVLM